MENTSLCFTFISFCLSSVFLFKPVAEYLITPCVFNFSPSSSFGLSAFRSCVSPVRCKKISRPFFFFSLCVTSMQIRSGANYLLWRIPPPFFSPAQMLHGGAYVNKKPQNQFSYISSLIFQVKIRAWCDKALAKNRSKAYIRMHTCMTSA